MMEISPVWIGSSDPAPESFAVTAAPAPEEYTHGDPGAAYPVKGPAVGGGKAAAVELVTLPVIGTVPKWAAVAGAAVVGAVLLSSLD